MPFKNPAQFKTHLLKVSICLVLDFQDMHCGTGKETEGYTPIIGIEQVTALVNKHYDTNMLASKTRMEEILITWLAELQRESGMDSQPRLLSGAINLMLKFHLIDYLFSLLVESGVM